MSEEPTPEEVTKETTFDGIVVTDPTNMVAQSSEIGKLAEALAKAQVKISGATKDKNNPFFHSKYADLAGIWDACRAPLSEYGLAVIQTTDGSPDNVIVFTTLAHSSGQWIRGKISMRPVPVKVSKDDPTLHITPQGIGSALTYARRYGLAAIVGVAPADDDGNRASGHREAPAERDKEPASKPKRPTPEVDKMLDSGQAVPVTPPVSSDKEPLPPPPTTLISKPLMIIMKQSKVTVDELVAYCKSRDFLPKDGKLTDLKETIQKQMILDENWKKVVVKIEASRKSE